MSLNRKCDQGRTDDQRRENSSPDLDLDVDVRAETMRAGEDLSS